MRASGGEFVVRPGVYVLSARGPVDRASLPASLGPLRFDEYHVPEPDLLPLVVQPLAAAQFLAGRPVELSARVVDAAAPDSVALWIRAAGRAFLRPVPMQPAPGYEYSATLPADLLGPGLYEYVITVSAGDSTWTFPERAPKRPSDWDYRPEQVWRMMIVEEGAPLRLLAPGEDFARLSFTRIADSARRGLFRVVASAASGEPALRLELPVDASGRSPEDFTASLVIEERVRARGEQIGAATALRLRLRGSGPRQVLHLTLMEQDGTSWSTAVVADSAWAEITLPLAELRAARGVHLPMGFPGTWNYWVGPAAGRGGAGDAIRIAEIERLQLSLHNKEGTALAPGHYGIELESITLLFE